jgi:hypothetical protein
MEDIAITDLILARHHSWYIDGLPIDATVLCALLTLRGETAAQTGRPEIAECKEKGRA